MTSQQAPIARASDGTVVPLPFTERDRALADEGRESGPRGATIRFQLICGPAAAAEARAVISMLEGCAPRELLDDARLLVSELVTNAVRHSGAPRDSTVELEVSAQRDRVRVEVTDEGDGFVPRPRTADQSKGSGWGLHLVERLATSWGVDPRPRARVWFELQLF
jgi:anti-sigma regulatory factor (Ser/Thr protein kinase)